MLCVMRVLNEFDPKEVTNLVSPPKCVKQMLDEFLDVMPKELHDELPPRKQVDHAIEVMAGVAPPAKAPHQMSHEELKELKVQLENFSQRVRSNLTSPYMGHRSSLFTRRMGH